MDEAPEFQTNPDPFGKQRPAFPFLEPRDASDPPDALGRLGHFLVIKLLGEGGMGMVLHAVDTLLDRHVALKVIRPEEARHPDARERFLREARAVAAIRHEHVIEVYSVRTEPVPHFDMPLLKGEELSKRLGRKKRLPVFEVLQIGRQVAEGLAAAHDAKTIHRDLKPDNVWLEAPNGRVKILDFGLARRDIDLRMTTTGRLMGTPVYMSPEQVRTQPLDTFSDLFSLGSVLYHLATGQLPFPVASLFELQLAICTAEPLSPTSIQPDIPAELSSLILRLLAKTPKDRPASARQVADELKAIQRSLAVIAKTDPGKTPAAPPKTEPTSPARHGARDLPDPPLHRRDGVVVPSVDPPGVDAPTARVGSATRASTKPKNFDRLREWLELPEGEWPPNHYVLLGLKAGEGDSAALQERCLERMERLRGYQLAFPEEAAEGRKRLVEAISCLNDPTARRRYDAALGLKLTEAEPAMAPPAPLPKKIVAAWEKAGAKVGWMGTNPSGHFLSSTFYTDAKGKVVEIAAFRFKVWRRGVLAALLRPEQPFGLDLSHTKVTDAGLKELAGLKHLQKLCLCSTQVSSAGLTELAGLKQLQELNLDDAHVTDAGLKELAGLKQLQNLSLRRTQVSDAGLKELAGLKQLQNLRLSSTQVTGVGFKELATLTELQALDLAFTKVTDAGLKELAGLKQLQYLNLDSTKVTDAGLMELAELKQLQNLYLSHTQVTDAGLKGLAGLKQLRALHLVDTQVTDVGLKELAMLTELQALDLAYTKLTDAGLKELAGLKQLQNLRLYSTQVTGAGLEELATLKQLQNLNLSSTKVTNAGLKGLAGLNQLWALDLAYTKVTDAGLKELAGLKQLQNLRLSRTQVTDVGLKELATLTELRALDLAFTKVTDAELKELAGLKQLQNLGLYSTQVTGMGLNELATLTELQEINLACTKVTDAGLEGLAGLKQLQSLSLGSTQVTNAGLKVLAGLKQLQNLLLSSTQVTDAGLKELAGLKQLQTLILDSTPVTDAGVAVLRKALPRCSIS